MLLIGNKQAMPGIYTAFHVALRIFKLSFIKLPGKAAGSPGCGSHHFTGWLVVLISLQKLCDRAKHKSRGRKKGGRN